MGKLIGLEYNGSKIFMETSEVGYEGGLSPAGAVETAEKNIEKMLEVVRPFCEALKRSIDSLGGTKPDSYSAEFGLSFTGEGNVFFAKVSAEATVKVTAIWGKS